LEEGRRFVAGARQGWNTIRATSRPTEAAERVQQSSTLMADTSAQRSLSSPEQETVRSAGGRVWQMEEGFQKGRRRTAFHEGVARDGDLSLERWREARGGERRQRERCWSVKRLKRRRMRPWRDGKGLLRTPLGKASTVVDPVPPSLSPSHRRCLCCSPTPNRSSPAQATGSSFSLDELPAPPLPAPGYPSPSNSA
jgi:hypothetical protein